jgi:uncharacterized peroxidase-related enzyme
MAVINAVPREAAAAEVKDIYERLEKTFGHMPGFFGVMAQRPAVLKSFMPFYSAIVNQGTIEPRYLELAYLKTSTINNCEYWTRAHSASGKRAGLTDEQILALPFFRRSHLFDEKEQATLLYAERVTKGASALREEALEELKKYYTEDQIVELTLVICVANFTNRFNDALQIEPDLGWASRMLLLTGPPGSGKPPVTADADSFLARLQ